MKTTKRALFSSVVALLLCFSMLLGTTFAWFTDSVTSANNVITSGNLDVEMYWADGTEAVPVEGSSDWTDASTGAIFDYDLWEPGYTQVRHVKIVNNGSLALKYKVSILANGVIDDADGVKLSDVIDVYYVDPAIQVANRSELTDANKLGTLTDVLAHLADTGNGALLPGESNTITIAFKMQETAGNEYMNKSIGTDFSVVLTATQFTYENDSFDNQYDKESEYSAVGSVKKNGNEPITVRAGNVEIVVPATASAGVYTLEVSPANMNTDIAGNTIVSMDISLFNDGVKVEQTVGIQYPVRIYLEERLAIIGVDHKGQAVENYNYNPDTGLITFETDSFSPFAVTYFSEITHINTAEDLISALTRIKDSAKLQIPGAEGNKGYRENAIFVLDNDIVIDDGSSFMYTDSNGAPLHFYGVKGILDLNGHSITVTSTALLSGKSYANAALLFQYSDVDIVGEGSIITENQSIPVYAWANCTVDIYGGSYITNAYKRNESAVYVNNATAFVNVYGGTYTDTAYAFNVKDTCVGASFIVLHEGITYADFLKNGTTDVTKADIDANRIGFAGGCGLYEYEANGVAMNKVVAN